MKVTDLEGEYLVTGKNQDNEGSEYKGILFLVLNKENRIEARWVINNNEEQSGTGFFKDNILVINFNYKGGDEKIYKGVAVYKCISKDVLDGFWSEKHGDPLCLGLEQCFRVKENKELLN